MVKARACNRTMCSGTQMYSRVTATTFSTQFQESYNLLYAVACIHMSHQNVHAYLLLHATKTITQISFIIPCNTIYVCSLKSTAYGFQLHLFGFSHKLPVLLSAVLTALITVTEYVTPLNSNSCKTFDVQKESLLRGLNNAGMKPDKQVR
jgi:Middle or third domain of peptidase_M16